MHRSAPRNLVTPIEFQLNRRASGQAVAGASTYIRPAEIDGIGADIADHHPRTGNDLELSSTAIVDTAILQPIFTTPTFAESDG